MDTLMNHYPEIILAVMGLAKVIVNLTPSEKDNKIFNWLDKLIDVFIPNLKKGGGKHK